MKKIISIYVLFFSILSSYAQTGIHFEQDLNWRQLLTKAKAEHKYIFLDCYASWCGPCKAMDKHVYPNDTVGEVINKNFISVKMQLDTSKQDNAEIKSHYADSHLVMANYQIKDYPTFLFLSPEGNLVHRGIGYLGAKDFINLSNDALNPEKQYYTNLLNYQFGNMPISSFPAFARQAKTLGQKDISVAAAKSYVKGYLDKLTLNEFDNPENINFTTTFIKSLSSDDQVFKYFYVDGRLIDSIAKNLGVSERVVNFIITQEDITPQVLKAQKAGKEPDWDNISKVITRKYNDHYAIRNVVDTKVDWYRFKEDWSKYAHYLSLSISAEQVENAKGVDGVLLLNNSAEEIFKYSSDKTELEKALLWANKAVELMPDAPNIDTKANILYKLGRKPEALKLQEKAAKMDPKEQEIQANFEKMRKNQPTWISGDPIK